MAEWSRRQVLAAFGAGALDPLIGGCRPPVATRPIAAPRAGIADELAEAIDALTAGFDEARGSLVVVRRRRTAVDAEGSALARSAEAAVWLAGRRGDAWFERRTTDLTPGALRGVVARMSPTRRAPIAARPRAGAGPAVVGGDDLDDVDLDGADDDRPGDADATWLERATALAARARDFGDSRVVHRNAALEIEEVRSLWIAPGLRRSQRLSRARGEVRFLALGRGGLVAESAVRVGAGGLEVTAVDDRALADAAEAALATFTAGPVSHGESGLVLSPAVAAAVVARAIAPGFRGDRWAGGQAAAAARAGQAITRHPLTLVDDPTLADGFGGYRFDDEGAAPRRVVLLDRGRIGEPVTDRATAAALGAASSGHGRRDDDARIRPAAAHLVLSPGELGRDELLDAAGRGFLLEGVIAGGVDPASWRYGVVVARAREIERGRLTGRMFGPVALRGDVPTLLAGLRGVGREAAVLALDERPAASVSSPALATQGRLAGTSPWG